ncbi:MAG: tyrosine-type recombinase/integrase [Anaerolineaceae bacterium]|nr:tyrosine-type recombinase/integrase [Anaerolineaceae bacterium]
MIPGKAGGNTLKHSIAFHLAESGADVKDLKNYIGHKKIDRTMANCYISDDRRFFYPQKRYKYAASTPSG